MSSTRRPSHHSKPQENVKSNGLSFPPYPIHQQFPKIIHRNPNGDSTQEVLHESISSSPPCKIPNPYKKRMSVQQRLTQSALECLHESTPPQAPQQDCSLQSLSFDSSSTSSLDHSSHEPPQFFKRTRTRLINPSQRLQFEGLGQLAPTSTQANLQTCQLPPALIPVNNLQISMLRWLHLSTQVCIFLMVLMY